MISFLSRHAAWVLAAGIFAGLLLPGVAAAIRPFLSVTVAGLLILSVMQTDYTEFRRELTRPLAPAIAVACLLVISPGLAFVIGTVLGLPEDLMTAVVLMAAAPPIMAAPSMALMLGLSASRMLAVTGGATLLAPFTLGLSADWLVGTGLRIDAFSLALRLAAFIAACSILAAIIRALMGHRRIQRLKPGLDVIGLTLLLTFAVAVMDGMAERLVNETAHILFFLVIAFAANALLQLAGGAAFYVTGARNALTVAFACGNRNMGLLLAVLPESSAPDVLLYFVIAQVPLYTLPALLSPMYNALLNRGK